MIENMFLTFAALFFFSVSMKTFTILDFDVELTEEKIEGTIYIFSAGGMTISALLWIWV